MADTISSILGGSSSLSDIWNDTYYRWTAVLGTLLVLGLSTRVISSFHAGYTQAKNGASIVPMVPYWIPVLGHIPNLLFFPDYLFDWTRQIYTKGIFSINIAGMTHNIIFKPGLGWTLLNLKPQFVDSEAVVRYIIRANFGYPKNEMEEYDRAIDDIIGAYQLLLSEPSLGHMVDTTINTARGTVPDFVTHSRSVVDQTPWERASNAKLVTDANGEQVTEVDLWNYVAFTANPSLIGTDFLTNNPTFFDSLWKMDKGFALLATSLPRWVPFPPLTRAHVGLRGMLNMLETFHIAMEKHADGKDPGPEWQNLDDVSMLIKRRMEIYREHKISIRARAACEAALTWAMNANANPLAFWMICRIYNDRELLEQIRAEIAPYVEVIPPSGDFGINEAPRLGKLDVDGLMTKCPLLKAAYVESLRRDVGPWSLKIVQQDFTLSEQRDKGAEGFKMKKGSFAHVAHELHHMNPDVFDNPDEWRIDRHLKWVDSDKLGEPQVLTVDSGLIRPYGGGKNMCKGRAFALKESLIFPSIIISFWDIYAPGYGQYKVPKGQKTTATRRPENNMRVWVKRRPLPK